jgi:hypothetical protein
MTTVSPHGLQIIGSDASRRVPARARVSACVADRDISKGVAAMNLELLLLVAVVAALMGAVLP